MVIIFEKFEKNKVNQKIAKAGVIEKLINIPLTLENMRKLIMKPSMTQKWKRLKQLEKIVNTFLKLLILKSWKTFHHI